MNKSTTDQPRKPYMIQGQLRKAQGSITVPENSGLHLVFTLVPENGDYDSPTSKILNKRWAKTREAYKTAFVNRFEFKLGNILNTAVGSDIWVIQAIAFNKNKEVDTEALKDGVKKLIDLAKYEKASVHVSQLTLDEAPELLGMFEDQLLTQGLSLYVYPRE